MAGLAHKVGVWVRFHCDPEYDSWSQRTNVPGLPDGETINSRGQGVKGQGRKRLKLDLEA